MEGERLADAELMQTNAVAPRNFDLLMGHATAAASSPMSNVGGGFGGGGFGGTSPQPAVGSILEQAMQRVSNNYHHAPAAAAFAVVPPAPMGGGMAPLPHHMGPSFGAAPDIWGTRSIVTSIPTAPALPPDARGDAAAAHVAAAHAAAAATAAADPASLATDIAAIEAKLAEYRVACAELKKLHAAATAVCARGAC